MLFCCLYDAVYPHERKLALPHMSVDSSEQAARKSVHVVQGEHEEAFYEFNRGSHLRERAKLLDVDRLVMMACIS